MSAADLRRPDLDVPSEVRAWLDEVGPVLVIAVELARLARAAERIANALEVRS